MDLLEDVLDSFNKYVVLICLTLSMGIFLLCGCNENSYINWGHWFETQAHLKRVVTNRAIKGSFIVMLNIRNDLIPCAGMFIIIHS